jgi:hypothetical protein
MSTLRVDNLNARTGTKITVPTGTTLYAPGHVLQVVQGWSDTYVTGSSLTWVAAPATVTITPTTTSSKILVSFSASMTGSTGQECLWRLKRNTTVIGSSAASATTTGICSTWTNGADWNSSPAFCQYLDSPSTTSAITYSFEAYFQDAGGGSMRIGRSSATSGSDSWGSPSIITAMEIGV